MKRVTGIGGVFFKAADPQLLCSGNRDHLGLDITAWGGAIFRWGGQDSPAGATVWSPFAADSDAMAPGTSSFMLNFRVDDLDALLQALREEGCNVVGEPQASEQGRFGWVLDPEGNKVELWQPAPGY
jgi:catechol 2,3-dioxygenase-like lactoylglutathione lyase family enzyme